jgi:tripartite-type tricarboxylate transporter receptor subunit TctC
MTCKSFLGALAAAALAWTALPAGAQVAAFPNQPIKVLVGYASGGPLDTVARIVAQSMSESLGQAVVVDNKPGASGLIATDLVKRSAPDGYTLLFAPSTYVVNPILMPKTNYDPVKDFAPISHIATLASVMITAQDSRIQSVRDLVAAAKVSPGAVSYGTTGMGGPAHLASELFQSQTGTQTTHIPFKGSAPALLEVMAGRVSYMFHPITGLKEVVTGKRIRPLAISGSASRLAEFPEVPTMAEAGFPGYEDVGVWFGVVAPAGTPAAIVARLNAAIQASLQKPATLDKLKAVGAVPTGGTPQQFQDFVARDVARWTTIIRAAKIELPNS